MKEKLPKPQLSSFVLFRDGQERRLEIDEKITLSLGEGSDEDHSIVSLEILPSQKYLNARIYYKNGGMVFFPWGLTKKRHDSDEEVFGVGLTSWALSTEGDKRTLRGSNVYFDEHHLRLSGENWHVDYKP
ncbi:MAG TPA: hypothetical protein VJ227_04570 [Patescibacteria group bacterium]|nr:hypothetical protein [Patescibacteria group bacterium]